MDQFKIPHPIHYSFNDYFLKISTINYPHQLSPIRQIQPHHAIMWLEEGGVCAKISWTSTVGLHIHTPSVDSGRVVLLQIYSFVEES